MASMKCVAVKNEQLVHSRGRDRDSTITIDSSDDEGVNSIFLYCVKQRVGHFYCTNTDSIFPAFELKGVLTHFDQSFLV